MHFITSRCPTSTGQRQTSLEGNLQPPHPGRTNRNAPEPALISDSIKDLLYLVNNHSTESKTCGPKNIDVYVKPYHLNLTCNTLFFKLPGNYSLCFCPPILEILTFSFNSTHSRSLNPTESSPAFTPIAIR